MVDGAGAAVIVLALVRVAVCEICTEDWILPPGGDPPPATCLHCGSKDWLEGPQSQDSIRVRMGITFATRKLDGRRDRRKSEGAGAKSLKRRERARKQYQSLKPKAIDDSAASTDN
jgi:hypothetical protein